jgi:hypothetical protein
MATNSDDVETVHESDAASVQSPRAAQVAGGSHLAESTTRNANPGADCTGIRLKYQQTGSHFENKDSKVLNQAAQITIHGGQHLNIQEPRNFSFFSKLVSDSTFDENAHRVVETRARAHAQRVSESPYQPCIIAHVKD